MPLHYGHPLATAVRFFPGRWFPYEREDLFVLAIMSYEGLRGDFYSHLTLDISAYLRKKSIDKFIETSFCSTAFVTCRID